MNPLHARAIAAQRKLEDGESLDQFDGEIINLALRRLIREGRVPFQRFRDHLMIGTERWGLLQGFDFYRTILLHRKSDVWYPESDMSEISIFAVYTTSQVEPPDSNVLDENRGKPIEYALDLLGRDEKDEFGRKLGDRAHIGPSVAGSYQQILQEAPPDWRINAIGTVQQSLRKYAQELGNMDSEIALERQDALEEYLRSHAKAKTKAVADGELIEVMDAYLRTQFYRGKPRAIRGPKQKVYDAVRTSCKYVLNVMQKSKSPITRDIAKHLEDYVQIGQTCEYKGDWKWIF